jgi:hypothetical protein
MLKSIFISTIRNNIIFFFKIPIYIKFLQIDYSLKKYKLIFSHMRKKEL